MPVSRKGPRYPPRTSTPAVSTEQAELAGLQKVTVIVVTFESAHCLAALVPLLAACPQVIVVDNASSDGSLDLARRLFPHAQLHACAANLGFGAACNRALDQVRTPLAFLLNPDALLEPGDLALLVQESQRFPDAAVLAPQLRSAHGAIDLSYRWPSNRWSARGPPALGPLCVGFASGAALLLVLSNMGQASRFDERFFLYYEDEDLCQRIFNARRQIIVVPDAQITHFSRGSVRGGSPLRAEFLRGYHHAQSKLIFEHKHVGSDQAAALRWRTLVLALLTLLPRLLVPQPRYLARLLGRIAGLCRDYPRGTRPIR